MEEEAAPARRSYDASGRRAAAEQRRLHVAGVAARLFAERGWNGTTLTLVATEAEVSVELVTKAFGGKAQLLMAAMHAASFSGRGDVVRAFADLGLDDEPDVEARLDRVVAFVAGSLSRMAPFVPVIVQGADTDPGLRTLFEAAQARHLATSQDVVRVLAVGRVGPDALDEVYLLTRAETYLLLVEQRGWTVERYTDWLRRSLRAAVDGPAPEPAPTNRDTAS